jgi:cytochrome c biogenesis protein
MILKRHRYRIIKADDGSGAYYGYRGFLAKIGVDIVHCAVLLIIVGGLVSVLTKQEYVLWLHEGDSHRLPTTELLTLDKFEYLKYEDGTPRDWLSHVTVFDNGMEKREAVIEVNKPLRHEGYLVYQSSYEYEYTLSVQIEYRDKRAPYSVKVGDVIVLDDLYLHMRAFTPSQSTDEQVDELAGDSTLNIDIYEGSQYMEQMHVSAKNSKAARIPIQAELISSEALLMSGLTVKKEAGFSIIIIAFVLITIGIIFNFYLSEKVIKVFKKDGQCFLFGGFVKRNSSVMTREWENMVRNH